MFLVQIKESEKRIIELEKELKINSCNIIPSELLEELDNDESNNSNNNNNNNNSNNELIVGDRLLTLYRISLYATSGSLISIVGQVGSGKSSILNALLGCCYYYYYCLIFKNRLF